MNRSELMARIKSRGNASTELAFARVLRREGVTGWRRQVKVLGVRPDFVFAEARIAVFVDGCFWHGCALHCTLFMRRYDRPKLSPYWENKIRENMRRDRRQEDTLRLAGWHVVRVWEHDLRTEARRCPTARRRAA